MVGTEMKISKQTEISGLAEFAFFETFLYISCTSFLLFFVIKLVVFVLPYIMSNITFVLKRQKVLFLVFSGMLGENLLGFYLVLIGLLFLDGKDK